jgi:deoxyribonucleoside regulator
MSESGSVAQRDELLVQVATLYYEQDYNQQEIAEHLGLSRSNVSRMLKESRERGLVEIIIRRPVSTVPKLERIFRKRFGLQQTMIVASGGRTYEEVLAGAGVLAARYLEALLRRGDILAISWGRGVSATVDAFMPNPTMQIKVVQMLGSMGNVTSTIDGHEIARRLATKLGGSFQYMHAPLLVDSPTARDMFLEQPVIAQTITLAKQARVALLGIGTTEVQASSFLRAGHLNKTEIDELRTQGAVGETAGRHFDVHGAQAGFAINERVVAVTLEDVKRIPHVLAVACGLPKHLSILGALRGGYIHSLATDDVTATAILDAAGAG